MSVETKHRPHFRAHEVLQLVPGLTYRRLDHWSTLGLVVTRVRWKEDSGISRDFPREEIAVLRIVIRLLREGFTLQAAFSAARRLVWGEEVVLADGLVRLSLDGCEVI